MFLRNLWGKSHQEEGQLAKYDRITFQININDNIPQFSNSEALIVLQEDQEITSNHPLYYQIFKKPQLQEQTQIYVTKEDDDSIGGIALKLNISESLIKSLNNLSGQTLFPNMKIKIPSNINLSILQDRSIEEPKHKISQLFQNLNQEKSVTKYEVYYVAGISGSIRGILTINIDYLMFNPTIQNEENKRLYDLQKLLKFFAIIEIQDIKEVMTMDLPDMTQQSQQPQKCHIVQLLLYKVGNKKVEEKYKQRLKKLKCQSKAIASISFKMIKDNEINQIAKKKEIAEKITERITKSKQKIDKQEESGLMTNIPYFDILYDNISRKDNPNQSVTLPRKRSSSIISSKLNQESMLPPQAFVDLATYFPGMQALCNWELIYTCFKNGSSFQTLLRVTNGISPLLLMIKQYKGNIIGAFIVDALEKGKTGRGEMFIWKYEPESKNLTAYGWTQKNSFFCFIDADGLGIGMGTKYGIFIKNTLDKGHSAPTDTFGNPEKLSVKDEFQIEDIEIWCVDELF